MNADKCESKLSHLSLLTQQVRQKEENKKVSKGNGGTGRTAYGKECEGKCCVIHGNGS